MDEAQPHPIRALAASEPRPRAQQLRPEPAARQGAVDRVQIAHQRRQLLRPTPGHQPRVPVLVPRDPATGSTPLGVRVEQRPHLPPYGRRASKAEPSTDAKHTAPVPVGVRQGAASSVTAADGRANNRSRSGGTG